MLKQRIKTLCTEMLSFPTPEREFEFMYDRQCWGPENPKNYGKLCRDKLVTNKCRDVHWSYFFIIYYVLITLKYPQTLGIKSSFKHIVTSTGVCVTHNNGSRSDDWIY
jgi:hypothetical protein